MKEETVKLLEDTGVSETITQGKTAVVEGVKGITGEASKIIQTKMTANSNGTNPVSAYPFAEEKSGEGADGSGGLEGHDDVDDEAMLVLPADHGGSSDEPPAPEKPGTAQGN